MSNRMWGVCIKEGNEWRIVKVFCYKSNADDMAMDLSISRNEPYEVKPVKKR